eukprot:TRINITY_DN9476_c0_g1_i1.p1 TRINITY_DN9476_c0_g1~~TRINITY_DN9476_c0_g1_i1.p1  ORF type:complete len:134 (-),score=8.17 TRINITY_DN9476_c0_g1_i1:181-543(-)
MAYHGTWGERPPSDLCREGLIFLFLLVLLAEGFRRRSPVTGLFMVGVLLQHAFDLRGQPDLWPPAVVLAGGSLLIPIGLYANSRLSCSQDCTVLKASSVLLRYVSRMIGSSRCSNLFAVS